MLEDQDEMKKYALNVLNGAFNHSHIEPEGITGQEMDADLYQEYIIAFKKNDICHGKNCFRISGTGHSKSCLDEAASIFTPINKRGIKDE